MGEHYWYNKVTSEGYPYSGNGHIYIPSYWEYSIWKGMEIMTTYDKRCVGKKRIRAFFQEGIVLEGNTYSVGKAISLEIAIDNRHLLVIEDMEGNVLHDFRI